ncbi:MAG: hypothetical protein ABI969_14810 [bacterium]
MHLQLAARATLGLVVFAQLVGCTSAPVEWASERSEQVVSPIVAISTNGALVDDSLVRMAARVTPPSVACAGSLRLARSGSRLFAVWWSPRADSTATLASSRSSDGGATWNAMVPVDTTDHGVTGCIRAPAAIAADSASGYVHVAYAMVAAEGPGLFFAHSMDGGATFHAPVPIVYGERLGHTSVAASGDRVVVAFEDPNSRTPRIGLALSKTMGHIFEDRVLPLSNDNGAATQPLVAVQSNRITVAWQESVASSGGATFRIRRGTLP